MDANHQPEDEAPPTPPVLAPPFPTPPVPSDGRGLCRQALHVLGLLVCLAAEELVRSAVDAPINLVALGIAAAGGLVYWATNTLGGWMTKILTAWIARRLRLWLLNQDGNHQPEEEAASFTRYLLNRAVEAVLNWVADALWSFAAPALGNYEAGPWVSWMANTLRNQMIEVLRRQIVEALWNYATEALGLP